MEFGCDEIKCINLIQRTDKRKLVEETMKKLEINIDFFPAVADKELPSRGCFRSHFKIIADAYNKGVKRLMIFEDDFEIRQLPSKKEIKNINKFLDNNEWDIFFLGGYPFVWDSVVVPTKYSNIYRGHFIATHAYILNTNAIFKYRNVIWGKPYKIIDTEVYKNNTNAYGYVPEIYKQRSISNDIGKNNYIHLKFLRILGELTHWYAKNINIKIKNILVCIILLIFLIILYKKRN